MGTVDEDLLPPLPKGYSAVKSDGSIPPLPKGFIPVAPTPLPKLGTIPDANALSQPSPVPYTPQGLEAVQQHDNAIRQQKQSVIDKQNKQLGDIYNKLDPATKKQWGEVQDAALSKPEDSLRQPSQKEIDHNAFMDKHPVLRGLAYIGSEGAHGTVQLIKGATHEFSKAMGGNNPAADLGSEVFGKMAENAADLGLTKNDIAQAQDNKATAALGMAANFAPSIAAGAALKAPQAMMFLQGVGQGKEVADKLDLNPVAKEALIQGSGAVNLLLADLPAFGKLSSPLRGKVASAIAMDAIKESAGKDLTESGYKSLLGNGANTFAEKFKRAPIEALDHYNNTVKTFGKLNVGNFALHKTVDALNGKPVFNETAGDLADNLYKSATQDAPIFAAIPMAKELSKLTPFSGYKNDVVQGVMADPKPDNVDLIKQQIADHGAQQGWSPEEIEATNKHVEKIATATRSLPSDLPDNKRSKAVGLVVDRNTLQDQLNSLQDGKKTLDPAVADLPTKEETFLTDKIDQANDKLRDIVSGTKTTYSKERDEKTGEETGKFLKTTGGKSEEISPSRYALESLERPTKIDELPKQAEPAAQDGLPEAPQEVPAEKVNEELTNTNLKKKDFDKELQLQREYWQEKVDNPDKYSSDSIKIAKKHLENPLGYYEWLAKGEKKMYEAVKNDPDRSYVEHRKNQLALSEGVLNNLKTENNESTTEKRGKEETDAQGQQKENAVPTEEKVTDTGEADAEPVIKENKIPQQPVTETTDKVEPITVENEPEGFGPVVSEKRNGINFDGRTISVDPITREKLPFGEGFAFGDVSKDNFRNTGFRDILKEKLKEHGVIYTLTGASDDVIRVAKKIMGADIEAKEFKIGDNTYTALIDKQNERGTKTEPKAGDHQADAKKEAVTEPNGKVSTVPEEKGKVASLSESEAKRKLELRKKFAGQLNDITRIPTLLADKEFREYAGLVLKEAAGDFKQFSKELIEAVGEKIREHLPNLFKELGGDEKQLPKEEPDGGTEVKKTILTKRAYEGTISDDVKKYLEEKGLTRASYTQEERSGQATDFINKFGEEAAYRAVEAGDIDGGMAASILAQLQIRNSRVMAEFPEGSDERDALAKKQADYIALAEKKGYLGGEFNGQLAYEYQNAELDYASVKRQVEKLTKKALTPEQEKKVKAITAENERLKTKLKEAEAKLIEETDKALSGDEPLKPKTEYVKRALDAVVKVRAQIRAKSYSDATGMVALVDTALSIIEGGIRTGMTVSKAIEKGISHIKAELKKRGVDAWEKEHEFRKDVTDAFAAEGVSDRKPSTDLKDLQELFADKADNKFTADEARDIWGYIKKQYIENGTSFQDAVSKTAEDLGLSWRQVSEAITTPKNKRISDEMWKRQADLTRNRTAIKNWIGDQNKSLPGRLLQKVSGLFRGVAVFGHGGIFVGTHAGMTVFNPSMWNKTIPAFFRGWKFAYGNEGDYQRSIEELKNSQNYILAQRAGLKNNPERINTEEYQKNQKYLGKLGLAGEKGFNAIKVLRQDLFDYHFNKLSAAERDDPAVAKSIAHLVNLATGATNVNIPAWVNEVSFAGGMEAARWEKLTASPVKATQVALNALFNPSKATAADRVFAKVWARRVGEQLATYSAMLLANAAIQNTLNPKNKVNMTHPNKPDFLKFKFGDVTIDPTSGMRSVAMFMYTLGKVPFTSKKDLHGEKRIKVVGKDIAGYARGKLSPLYSTAADIFTGEDFNGNTMPYSKDKPSGYGHKLTWGEYAWSKAPLPIAEAANVAYKSAIEHGAHRMTLEHVINGIMSGAISGTTGFRVGEYDANSPENKKKK